MSPDVLMCTASSVVCSESTKYLEPNSREKNKLSYSVAHLEGEVFFSITGKVSSTSQYCEGK